LKKSSAATGIAVSAVALSLALAGCGSSTTTVTSSSSSSSSISATTATSATEGANPTIADYIKENGIVETVIHRGDAGIPTINLPLPTGWEDAGSATPDYAFSDIMDSDPAVAADPPSIVVLVSKLTPDVDAAKILQLAPGELKNLSGFEAMGDGSASTLGGFNAFQLGGTYQKNGATRLTAQKTVVIPGQDGLYVLQLTADGLQDQMQALMDATNVIDEQTTITP
jgi:hypothetical protein